MAAGKAPGYTFSYRRFLYIQQHIGDVADIAAPNQLWCMDFKGLFSVRQQRTV
jgi:hypothetical protein